MEKKALSEERHLSMRGIGRFEMSLEDQPVFQPDTQGNFLNEVFRA
ncbi:MAG: hypothetical protein ACMUEM_07025 [Flavobacteriales bacterium AspAUS03]